jgi:hypothetical protein
LSSYLHKIYKLFVGVPKYHKFFAVIQSSGWGKTRLLTEACKQFRCNLIFACFRIDRSTMSGYPPRVDEAQQLFSTFFNEPRQALTKCVNLLRGVLLEVHQGSESYREGLKPAAAYDRLWKNAAERAMQPSITEDFNCLVRDFSKIVVALSTTSTISSSDVVDSDSSSMSSSSTDFESSSTSSSSSSSASSSTCPFDTILMFDEASFLVTKIIEVNHAIWEDSSLPSDTSASAFPNSTTISISTFQLLRRALLLLSDALVRLRAVAAFIDTTTSVSNFIPSDKHVAPQSSLRAQSARLMPVYCCLNADPAMFSHEDPVLFGRPMFGAVVAQGQSEQAVVQLAQYKILGGSASFARVESEQHMALSAGLMSCLLDLDVRTGWTLTEALIRSYMVRNALEMIDTFPLCLHAQ